MKTARIFRDNEEPINVSAEDVKNELYSRDTQFVDPKYEQKVQYVCRAKNNGGPYFRLYISYEDYKRMYPDRPSREDFLMFKRRFYETQWHQEWKNKFSHFCKIEKYIKNHKTNKWKYADAFYEETQTCIEFQHSYIAMDFEKRNEFYSELSIDTVWLCNLPCAEDKNAPDGNIEILEDNAWGFFRISENPDNLLNHKVYIQAKSGKIYRVKELLRRESSTELKSTIRYFVPTEIYTENEFIDAVKRNTIGCAGKPLNELWSTNYSWMKVKNIEKGDVIFINRNHEGEMYRNFSHYNCIEYTYADDKYGYKSLKDKKSFYLKREYENRPIWVLVDAQDKNN